MYAFIKGRIAETGENRLVLENNGIGYELTVTTSCLLKAAVGGEMQVFTYLAVREDGMTLFGFSSREEKDAFLKLIGVGGVGPKLAVTVLSGISLTNLSVAVATNDIAILSKIKGVGKKTAERIILELKEKLSPFGGDVGGEVPIVGDIVFEEAVLALTALGISRSEALRAVQKSRSGADTVEKLIALSLKNLN